MPENTPSGGTRPRLGLIQSRGLGDIIIALPIAKYWADAGWDVYWPIDARFLPSFRDAVDYVHFIPFAFDNTTNGFLMEPIRILKAQGCEKIITLYSYISNAKVSDPVLFNSLKFDEYKYAIAGVPFSLKWSLSITRNQQREESLYSRLVKQKDYIVTHLTGSNCRMAHRPDPKFAGMQVIDIQEQTESIFDWLRIIENAKQLVMVDSCFSNLTEQLNISIPKALYLRSDTRFTPVYKNGWKFAAGIPAK